MDNGILMSDRNAFRLFRPIATRWLDNDVYGHVNNVVYYAYFDTAVNGYLLERTGLDIRRLPALGVVAETSCRYRRSVSFPDPLEVGLVIERLGTRSITYRLGIFVEGETDCVAEGRFVHVYVDATTRHSVEIPSVIRAAVEPLLPEKS